VSEDEKTLSCHANFLNEKRYIFQEILAINIIINIVMGKTNAIILNFESNIMLSPITLKFLEAVKINNNTERMHKNRDLYLQERKRFTELVEHLIIDMQKINPNLN
jgi:hypothetical protein